MTHLKAIVNLAATTVIDFDIDGELPTRPEFTEKDEMVRWAQNARTDHIFYSGYVGSSDSLRIVDRTNPPIELRAFIADFDADCDALDIENRLNLELEDELMPYAISRTFSGGIRLIWVLDKPVCVNSKKLRTLLLARAKTELKLERLAPGLDHKAWSTTNKYYELGTEWRISGNKLASSYAFNWMFEAARSLTRIEAQGAVLPLEVVENLVQSNYPGRWTGPFTLNARGVRFWDPQADNETAAVIKADGMLCFTGDRAFLSWVDIFGRQAIDRHHQDRISMAVEDVWFDGSKYWKLDTDGQWIDISRQDTLLWLRGAAGLSSEAVFEGEISEDQQALLFAQQYKRIDAAVPLVCRPNGLTHLQGKKLLNISKVMPLEPASHTKGEEEFPWISNFLHAFFANDEQLETFLAWLQRFYRGCVEFSPEPGQAVFIAGPVERGKTLLSTVLVSRLVGGHADASDFLTGATGFSGYALESALWAIDDGVVSSNMEKHSQYSAMLKKVVANSMFLYNEKFKTPAMIPWNGRVIVTCNLDSESLEVLPNIDTNILDKLLIFRVNNNEFHFPANRKELDGIISRELPFFARWLLDWSPSEDVIAASRYGVHAYHDESTLNLARAGSKATMFAELLNLFLAEYFRANEKATYWEGTATQLVRELSIAELLSGPLGKNMTPRNVGKSLVQLQNQGEDVTHTTATVNERSERTWRIPRTFLEAAPAVKTKKGKK